MTLRGAREEKLQDSGTRMPPDIRARFQAATPGLAPTGIAEGAFSVGDRSPAAPLPGTVAADAMNIVRWAFVDADCTKRPEPAEVLVQVRVL